MYEVDKVDMLNAKIDTLTNMFGKLNNVNTLSHTNYFVKIVEVLIIVLSVCRSRMFSMPQISIDLSSQIPSLTRRIQVGETTQIFRGQIRTIQGLAT